MASTDRADNSGKTRRNFILICLGLISAFVVQTMLLVAVPLAALDSGATPAMVGAILSAPHLLPLLLALPLARIITRNGGRAAVIVAGLSLMLGAWIPLFVPGLMGLVLTQLLVGTAHMVMILAGQAIVSGLGTGKVLERHFGLYTSCISAGQLIGPVLAGWLLDLQGRSLTFGVTGVVAGLALISGIGLTGSARKGAHVERSITGFRAQLRLLQTHAGMQVSIALTISVIFVLGAYGAFLPVYLESLSVSATGIGVLLSLRALSSMVIRPFMSFSIQALGGRVRSMLISAIAAGLGLMFTGGSENLMFLGALAVLIGIASGISQPLSMIVLAETVPHAQRPSALGMRLMANRAVQFLAPVCLGVMAEALSYSVTFFIGGLVVMGLVVLMASRIPAFIGAEITRERF